MNQSKFQALLNWVNTNFGTAAVMLSPIVSPIPSAVAIFLALRAASFDMVTALSMMMAVETIGFAAVWSRDHLKDEGHRKRARNIVFGYVTTALITVLMFETVPTVTEFAAGRATWTDVARHAAPLVYPFFSFLGANVYSLIEAVRLEAGEAEAVINKQVSDLTSRLDRVTGQRDRLAREHEQAVNMNGQLQETVNRLNVRVADVTARLETVTDRERSRTVTTRSRPRPTVTDYDQLDQMIVTNVRDRLGLSQQALADDADVSKGTVNKRYQALVEAGILSKNGSGYALP